MKRNDYFIICICGYIVFHLHKNGDATPMIEEHLLIAKINIKDTQKPYLSTWLHFLMWKD